MQLEKQQKQKIWVKQRVQERIAFTPQNHWYEQKYFMTYKDEQSIFVLTIPRLLKK